MKTVCFTGHRPEKLNFSEGDDRFKTFRNLLFKVVNRLCELGYTQFISGMARGFDMWAAEAVCRLKTIEKSVSLVCAVPFPDQAKSWKPEEKARWEAILNESDETANICDRYTRDCFHRRNRYMVDNSEVVVCLYDGTKGGTAYTVDYALKKGKIVIQINPQTFEVSFLSKETI